MTETRKLKDGVVGSKLVDYFQSEHGITPVAAKCLKYDLDTDQVQYRIDFDGDKTSDWLVTFERTMTEDVIVNAECFNEVL